jgi:hypothetical protein
MFHHVDSDDFFCDDNDDDDDDDDGLIEALKVGPRRQPDPDARARVFILLSRRPVTTIIRRTVFRRFER